MKIALMLRGHHEKKELEGSWIAENSFCFKKLLPHFQEMILQPLVKTYGAENIGLFVITYESTEMHDILIKKLGIPLENIFARPKNSSTQTRMYSEGLIHLFPKLRDYDMFYVTRFDLAYKKPITEWIPANTMANKAFWFTWRETEHSWNAAKRVGDVIHVMKGVVVLECFIQCLYRHACMGHNCMHEIYPELVEFLGRVGGDSLVGFLCEDGFYDSNTGRDNHEYRKNPLYILSQRGYFHDDFVDPAINHAVRRISLMKKNCGEDHAYNS